MVNELPVPIGFCLPEGWRAAPPDVVGAAGVAFVALHPASANGFTANLTIAGQLREPELTTAVVAAESVHRLARTVESVYVRKRVDVGSADAPGVTQILDLQAGGHRLVQFQVYASVPGISQEGDDRERQAVLELVLTCTPTQLDAVLPDFEQFIRTVHPMRGGKSS